MVGVVRVEVDEDKVEEEWEEGKERKGEETSNRLKQPRHGALNVSNLVPFVVGGDAAAAAAAAEGGCGSGRLRSQMAAG